MQTHPSINRADVTIVTDQDKGSMGRAIEEILRAAGHFFCVWHRRKNVIKQCGGSSGRVPYSALWVYKLIECRSMEHFNKLRDRYFPLMDRRDLQYLNNIEDHAQYPVR